MPGGPPHIRKRQQARAFECECATQPRFAAALLYCRFTDAAVLQVKEMAQQAVREFGTQMTREDHFVDARGDYYIEPRAYKDSEEYASVRVKATIVVQCYARGMFGTRHPMLLPV
jgi:hypothetical protein